MNNLTTRKIVLGLLMMLVLMFGVQGIADAISQVSEQGAGADFTAIFNDGANFENGPGPVIRDTSTNGNDVVESFTIDISSGIHLTEPAFTASDVTVTEKDSDGKTNTDAAKIGNFFYGNTDLGTSVSIAGYFTSVGRKTITIKDNTSSVTDGYQKKDPVTFVFYVVKSDSDISETTTLQLKRDSTNVNSQGYITGLDGRTDFYIYGGGGRSNYPVKYSVDGGMLYVGTDKSYAVTPTISKGETRPPSEETSSSYPEKVWLDMNGDDSFGLGDTSVVTVTLGKDADESVFKVAYIRGTPKLGINLNTETAGVDSFANHVTKKYRFSGGERGSDAGTIAVTVRDGSSLTGATIEGVLVKFELKYKGSTTGYLRAGVTGIQVDAQNNQTAGALLPDIAQTLYVQTGGNGVAQAIYEFGSLESQEITVSSVGLSEMVTAEFGSSALFKAISEDTNKQRAGNSKEYDLIALVKDDEELIEDMVVTFTTNNGSLTRVSSSPTATEHGVPDIDTGKVVNVVTNVLGEAHVVYDIGNNTGRQEIHASIYDNNLDDDAGTLGLNPNVIAGVSETTF